VGEEVGRNGGKNKSGNMEELQLKKVNAGIPRRELNSTLKKGSSRGSSARIL